MVQIGEVNKGGRSREGGAAGRRNKERADSNALREVEKEGQRDKAMIRLGLSRGHPVSVHVCNPEGFFKKTSQQHVRNSY